MNRNFFSLGLMSGTSMDGIDFSIIKSDGERSIEIIDNMYLEYDSKLKSKLSEIVELCTSKKMFKKFSKEIKKIEREITLYHAKACQLIIEKNKKIKIDLLGFHGQTILHKPHKGYSIQIGDSNLLAKLTNINVISNFRENDIVNGGQGAPLASLYHQLILNKVKTKFPSAIINIGGIANITYMERYNKILSFDTGPGNYLIDKFVKNKIKMKFDKDGLIAKSGNVNEIILNKFLNDLYYKKKHPKSLDVKYFNLQKVKKLNLKDGLATLSMLTVKSICMAINSFNKYPKIILISGGGRKKKYIVDNIKKNIEGNIFLIDKFNFDGDFVESQAFAYLAIRSYLKKNITFPSTTGVRKPCSGGFLFRN